MDNDNSVSVARRPNKWPQEFVLTRLEDEILYWGARWWGKTDAWIARMLYYIHHPDYKGLVVRENASDLDDWVGRAIKMYRHVWGEWRSGDKSFVFPSGARIKIWHLGDALAYTKYQGHEYQKVLIEELTNIGSEQLYLKLKSSCRSTVTGLKPQVFATTNPWWVGHVWVKNRFVDCSPPWVPYIEKVEAFGKTLEISRIFVPAKMNDNPIIMEKDPAYVARLNDLPEDLRRAWIEWDWNVFDSKWLYYQASIHEAMVEERVTDWLYDPKRPVYVAYDIWVSDNMVLTCFQFYNRMIAIIDCIAGTGEGIEYYINILEQKWYKVAMHILPHDAKQRRAGRELVSTADAFYDMWLPYTVLEVSRKENGIRIVRSLFKRMYFEASKTKEMLDKLSLYRNKYDEKNRVFTWPVHDESSHWADSLRYGMIYYAEIEDKFGMWGYIGGTTSPRNPYTAIVPDVSVIQNGRSVSLDSEYEDMFKFL